MTDECDDLFANRSTTLADTRAAGWYIDVNSGGSWWFTLKGTIRHHKVPAWVHELVADARKSGAEEVRCKMRSVLGLKIREQSNAHST